MTLERLERILSLMGKKITIRNFFSYLYTSLQEMTLSRFITMLLTIGATVAFGFLGFAGMFVMSSSLAWCGVAFFLAAYEGQISGAGISAGIKRLITTDFLKQAILNKYLDDLANDKKNLSVNGNAFLILYRKYKESLRTLKSNLATLEVKVDNLTDVSKQIACEAEIEQTKEGIVLVENDIQAMQKLFYNQFVKKSNNEKDPKEEQSEFEKSANALLNEKKLLKLEQEIINKKWLIRLGALFALGSGISSGLAAFSAIEAGVTALTFLSFIPGGVLISLAAFTAVGYAFLLYQTMSGMIQEYGDNWKDCFKQRKDEDGKELESKRAHGLRIAATIFMVAVAIVATVATAGTWWYAAKEGGELLKMGERAASALRSVTVSMMALPSVIFNTVNSVSAINKISESSYISYLKNVYASMRSTIKDENSLWRNFNIFRAIEKIFSSLIKTVLFVGHVISMGLISDRFEPLTAEGCAIANIVGELAVDANLLSEEDEEDEHNTKILNLIFFPVTLLSFTLKLFAVLWDTISTRSFTESWNHICASVTSSSKKLEAPKEPEVSKESEVSKKSATPEAKEADEANKVTTKDEVKLLVKDWEVQKVRLTCDEIAKRLNGKSSDKVTAVKSFKKLVASNNKSECITNQTDCVALLSSHRSSIWNSGDTSSKRQLEKSVAQFNEGLAQQDNVVNILYTQKI